MSNSRYEYVKEYEIHNTLLKGTFIVVRVDGKGFTKFCQKHNFKKPNDIRCIQLMVSSALSVCESFPEIILAYGCSDEFSFCFKTSANVYQRREQKILSVLVSTFTSAFIFNWPKYFIEPLLFPAVFDGRVILYPNLDTLKDYFYWRQVDCHINNLYNTTFWLLVDSGMSTDEAHQKLKGSLSKDKHELMFSKGINYNNIEEVYKKGSIILRFMNITKEENSSKKKKKEKLKETEEDISDIIDKIETNKCMILDENNKDSKYLLYDKTLNTNREINDISEFEKEAIHYFSNGLKILNTDIITNKEFWENIIYK